MTKELEMARMNMDLLYDLMWCVGFIEGITQNDIPEQIAHIKRRHFQDETKL